MKIPATQKYKDYPIKQDEADLKTSQFLKHPYLIKLQAEYLLRRKIEMDRVAREELEEKPADYKQYSNISENITHLQRALQSNILPVNESNIVKRLTESFRFVGDKEILETFLDSIKDKNIDIDYLKTIFNPLQYYFSKAIYAWKEGDKPKTIYIKTETSDKYSIEDLSFITKLIPNSKLYFKDDSLVIKIIF